MARVDHPQSPLVAKLRGVHLFGFDGAPCSQRVSFALAEKGLRRARSVPWRTDTPRSLEAPEGSYVFRNVSLIKHDNLSEAYAAIQPHLVVPALVRDGTLFVESMEIIDTLDEMWPERPLTPTAPVAAALCAELVERGKALHRSVRHVTFRWSLGRLGKTDRVTAERARAIEAAGSPEEVAAFYGRFNGDAIDPETFVHHLHALEEGYREQDGRLAESGAPFLTGSSFASADIIWAIKVLRLRECGYPFARRFPHLEAWYQRVSRRRGFREGVLRNHRLLHHAFRAKAAVEHWFGGGIRRAMRAA